MESATSIRLETAVSVDSVEESQDLPSQSLQTRMPRWLQNLLGVGVGALFLWLPIAFGGVHPENYLSAHALGYALLALAFFCATPYCSGLFSQGTFSRSVILVLFAFLTYLLAQTLAFSLKRTDHPVLGSSSGIYDVAATWSALSQYVFFICSFALARIWLGHSEKRAQIFKKFVGVVGFLVALTALTHWFYDNGKLFWTFEPNYVASSTRARWPFVNPNHLASYLLPIFFLFAMRISYHFGSIANLIREKMQDPRYDERKGFRMILSSIRFQGLALKATLCSVGLLAAGLAIAGTLSRGGWLGWCVGLLGLLLIEPRLRAAYARHALSTSGLTFRPERKLEPEPIIESAPASLTHSRKRPRRRRRVREESEFFERTAHLIHLSIKPLLLIFVGLVFYSFLAGRGSELIQDRINYGLMYSKDDIRWQVYSDTLPMIKENLFWGVGFGNWLAHYPKYMNQQLSGLNPEYLHSEPLQILAETGLAGIFLILAGLFLLIRSASPRFSKLSPSPQYALSGVFLGILTVIVASFVDFPFRIPAIQFSFACYIAITAFYFDLISQRNP